MHSAQSVYADEDDRMQVLEQQPEAREHLTPLPDFVISYHNPPAETFGGRQASASDLQNGMKANRLQRKSFSQPHLGTDAPTSLSSGGGYVSRRRIRNVKPSEPIKSGSSDEKRAMSNGMVSLLNDKMSDLRNVMNKVNNFLPKDLEAGKGDEVFDLAIGYLHMSDHDGPAGSKKLQKGLLKKVDSLGRLAKRLGKEIPADVDRNSDLYDLRSYFRGHRGVDIYGTSSVGVRKRTSSQSDIRPGSASSEFRHVLSMLDPSEFNPETTSLTKDGVSKSHENTYAQSDSMSVTSDSDSRFSVTLSDKSLSLTHNRNSRKDQKHASSAASLTLSMARQQLVQMQKDKRRRIVARRNSRARKQRNTLSRIAESFAIRSVPDSQMLYRLGDSKPPLDIDAKLVLGYVADSMRTLEGSHAERIFRNYFLSMSSRRAFTLIFWQTYLRCFQHPILLTERRTKAQAQVNKRKAAAQAADIPVDSEKERSERVKLIKHLEQDKKIHEKEIEELDTLLAATYIQLLSSVKVETHKPIFYRYFALALAEAIYQTFYFYCPGSRNLYDNKFKRVLYQKVANTMSGMPMYPVSAAIMSAAVFGSVIIDESKDGKNVARFPSEPLPSGHSTVPRSFKEPSIWIPAGKTGKSSGNSKVTHVSPLVRKFLGKPLPKVGPSGPLPTKRSKPTTTRYRLPNAFKMIHLAEDKMRELRANYDFKISQYSNDKRFDRKAVKDETLNLENLKQSVLRGPLNERQRYAFHILDVHKKSAQKVHQEAALKRL